jgi:K(+)-stimulated pyrophosphate-energized sodium pump
MAERPSGARAIFCAQVWLILDDPAILPRFFCGPSGHVPVSALQRQSLGGVLMSARFIAVAAMLLAVVAAPAWAASEADLVIPDLNSVPGLPGRALLMTGMLICLGGGLFGLMASARLRKMPVHAAMGEVAELIYATCRTYLRQQGVFIALLGLFLAAVIVLYFYILRGFELPRVIAILMCSAIGIAGSFGVAWFGIRVNTYANARAAFASLRGKPFPCYSIPLEAGMSIGMLLISVELFLMLGILVFVPPTYAGPCFIGFAIGESLGAAALRIAGGIFTKIADIGSDLMKIVLGIKEDDARNPGVIADCTGDNAGDSVGPTADGFETYGVTGVALITFVLLAVKDPGAQVQLLVWLFLMRVAMLAASPVAYWINEAVAKSRYSEAQTFDFEAPLTSLVWIATAVSVVATYLLSWIIIPSVVGDTTVWWRLATIITCGTLAAAVIPEIVKIFTSTRSGHVREVLVSSREGGASLNVLSGLTAGNFSVFWLTLVVVALMATASAVAEAGLHGMMLAPTVFAFGLVAFGFLSLGPVTIALDSYGPVTDNAQSIYELSLIETIPGVENGIKRDFGFQPDFTRAKHALEEADAAGNTFKATAKPVLIGTAVVGATTLIFSIVMVLTNGLTANLQNLSIIHPPFFFGLILGGAVIYWFSGASTQAVVTGAYRAVEFIRANIRLEEGVTKASVQDSSKVVEICTVFAQRGMFNIFLAVFFGTLATACADPYLFIGYLVATAIVGLYQAVFMANAGGAWDNAKKIVEVELGEKKGELHAATVVGDTVGDPFKDTSSVALNPIIKFTTLFGLLAVELALELGPTTKLVLSTIFALTAFAFVWRSFYGMRIDVAPASAAAPEPAIPERRRASH